MKPNTSSLKTRSLPAILVLFALLTIPAMAGAQAKPAPAQPDISGMYSFLREGEFVQVNIEGEGVVSGFVSRYGDTESDKGAFLDQFFDKASYTGTRLSFTTKPVHGVWFEFDGNVSRGTGKTPSEDSYWVIRGKLTQYEKDANLKPVAKSRDVEFKSFPQDYAADAPAKKN